MENILIVTPLQKEYDNLHNGLTALDLKFCEGKIGKLEVHHIKGEQYDRHKDLPQM